MLTVYVWILLTGFAVSFISTLFGLGGGLVIVPVLSLILPYSHIEAIATSLVTIIMVAAYNTYSFHRRGLVRWPVVPWIALSSSFIAFLAGGAATVLPEKLLIVFYIAFLLALSIRTFSIRREESPRPSHPRSRLLSTGIGGLSGFIAGLTGVGGGGITTSLMLVTKLTTNVQATPTSNAIMIFTCLFASIPFAMAEGSGEGFPVLGYVHLDTAFLLFTASFIITQLGVSINQRFPLFWRKTILGLLMLSICVRLTFLLLS
ncbi:MAG: sulfite exporter TauE/SafE family protein [Deltaproteobacteria bacterium]|nr:sulfite exporter TauE/SafE family protein [Deltaproteobacteria bacterium]